MGNNTTAINRRGYLKDDKIWDESYIFICHFKKLKGF